MKAGKLIKIEYNHIKHLIHAIGKWGNTPYKAYGISHVCFLVWSVWTRESGIAYLFHPGLTKAVLNRLLDDFYRLAICAFILKILFFGTSVSTNLRLFRMIHFRNFCNETYVTECSIAATRVQPWPEPKLGITIAIPSPHSR